MDKRKLTRGSGSVFVFFMELEVSLTGNVSSSECPIADGHEYQEINNQD